MKRSAVGPLMMMMMMMMFVVIEERERGGERERERVGSWVVSTRIERERVE